MSDNFRPKLILTAVIISSVFLNTTSITFAQEAKKSGSPVELNGDIVEYSMDGNMVTAKGNVIVKHPDATLSCDEVQFDRSNSMAHAKGHVRLLNKQGEISSEELTFDFNTMTGDFHNARIVATPYYGGARKISRVSASKIVMEDGYVTTSDFDKPEYKMVSSKIEVYPNDKIVARHNRLKVGPFPLAYIPRYTQSLKVKEPRFQFTPGYDKDWGIFLLTAWRYYVSENFKGSIHVDLRELMGIAYGVDLDYNTQAIGEGVLKTYFTQQERLTSKRVGEEEPLPARDGENRYKAEWRHRWKIDEKTNAIMQFYKLSDADFLKDYFEREFDRDQAPPTFFVLTHALPKGTLSLRTDKRVNNFFGATERLPELRYDLSHQEIGETGLYYTNLSTLTSLSRVAAAPSNVRFDTNRAHSDQQLSYPMKLSIFELSPFVGGEWTAYSRARDRSEDENIREYYKAGTNLQTKFYRVFNVNGSFLGEEIDRMRHIITPSLNYQIAHDPSISNSQIEQIDSIDSRLRKDRVTVSLENKLQVKNDEVSRDLMRALVSSDYNFKDDPAGEGFHAINAELDLHPSGWLTFYFDSNYNLDRDRIETANFDTYINSGKKWKFGIGRRYNVEVDDQITTRFHYMINPKWKFRMYNRLNINDGKLEEQEYVLTRDLHSWEVDFLINDDQESSEFMMVFRLKAFPDVGFDFGNSFNRRESGSSPDE